MGKIDIIRTSQTPPPAAYHVTYSAYSTAYTAYSSHLSSRYEHVCRLVQAVRTKTACWYVALHEHNSSAESARELIKASKRLSLSCSLQ